MLSTLALGFALTGPVGADPRSPPELPVLPGGDFESFYRKELARTKSRRAFLEETIKMFERDLKESPPLYTPKDAARIRRAVAEWREHAEFMRKWEQELEWWEKQRKENPGPETDRKLLERLARLVKEREQRTRPTAPMPREVKPKPR